MKKRIALYAFLPIIGVAGFFAADVAFAHGFGGFGGFSANLSPDQIASEQQTMFQNQAQILGISVADLKEAWVAGKSFSQIMQGKGIDKDQVQARMNDLRQQQIKSRLQILVDGGVITQTQADKRLETMKNMFQNKEMRKMGGMRRGFYF